MNEKKMCLTDWEFKASDDVQWLSARVPGCVHTDLLKHEKIPEPFYGTNENSLQWIDKKDWEYASTFSIPEALYNEARIELIFEGLDTYAEVYLNGAKILSADNMFRSYHIDIKPYARKEGNKLHVYFRSPVHEGLVKLAQQGYELPATNDVSEIGGLGDKKVSIFSRKAPYHFGWDWGPRFVTSGIWKKVYLHAWSDVRIEDLYIQQHTVNTEEARVTAHVEMEALRDFEGEIHFFGGGVQIQKHVGLSEGKNMLTFDFTVEQPSLWWCNGLGEPTLYDFSILLKKGEQVFSRKSVRTGLRSLRLVRDKDTQGSTFYFELNGRPVFAKGANHIPNDSFITEVDEARYKYEIQSAAEANMNMLRVWGGGIYEYDAFYNFCDEYGILVWQDFMFACSMYPGNEAFQKNVQEEAEENIKRLRNHPSIALWCGNNEMDTAWSAYEETAGWGWKQQYTPELRDKIWKDYETIFHEILPNALEKHSPGVAYWPSSPMQGLTNGASQHATNDAPHGDIHYWGVWHNVEPFENYNEKIGRFMSEYGFQSFPEEKTVRSYAEEADMALESEVMLQHQKNGSGNRLIRQYMEQYFNEAKDFPAFLYMSQVQQAEAIKMAIEAHRRNMPFTMGSLYWQINDCWPVASWSSMDYYGRWKALHYYARKSFKTIIASVDGRGGKAKVYTVSDENEAVESALEIVLMNFKGKEVERWEQAITVAANTAECVWDKSAEDILGGRSPRDHFLKVSLKTEDESLDEKLHYFVPDKELNLMEAHITVEMEGDGYVSELTLASDELAKQVWVCAEKDGVFTDNYFDLIPGEPLRIQFLQPADDEKMFVPASPGKLIVKSMADFIL